MIVSRINFVSPYRLNQQGHLSNYIASVHSGAVRRGLDFRAFTSRDTPANFQRDYPIQHVFHDQSWDKRLLPGSLDLLFGWIVANSQFYRDLVRVKDVFSESDQIFLVDWVDHRIALGLAWWLRRFGRRLRSAFVLVFRMDYFRFDRQRWSCYAPILRLAFRILEHSRREVNLCLVTDSERLAERFRLMTSLPIQVLPIPHTRHIAAQSHRRENQPVNLISLGPPNHEKGFDVLASAIRRLDERNQLGGLLFTLHVHRHLETQESREWRRILDQLPAANIRLIDRFLSDEEYYLELEQADIALLPYGRDKYYADTSGLFTEALAAGKPVVVTDGTWMSAQLEKYGAGITFRDRDVDDLARAILEARDNYPSLVRQAVARQPAWVGYHNPDKFVDELLEIVSDSDNRSYTPTN